MLSSSSIFAALLIITSPTVLSQTLYGEFSGKSITFWTYGFQTVCDWNAQKWAHMGNGVVTHAHGQPTPEESVDRYLRNRYLRFHSLFWKASFWRSVSFSEDTVGDFAILPCKIKPQCSGFSDSVKVA